MRVDTTGAVPEGWSSQDGDVTTTAVGSGENTLSQVAARLGVAPEDLQKANPQIANPNALTLGLEIRIPPPTTGNPPASSATDGAPGTDAASAASKRMEGNLDAAAMRAMLSSAWGSSLSSTMAADSSVSGSGGITQEPPVAGPPGSEGYSPEVKKDLTDKLRTVYQSPQFQSLSPAEKNWVLQTLASNPPLTQEKMAKALDLLGSAKNLSPADRKLALEGFRAAHADPAYAANVKKLIDDPKFKSLTDAEKTAVLSQVKNYPDARTVGNIDRMLQKDWFTTQSLDDKQRSLKTIARFSHNPQGDRQIIDNTLEKFIGEKSDFKLEWKTYPSGSGTMYGEGGDKTLSLNKGLIAPGNDKMVENEDTDRLSLNTVAHEVNHLLNNDKVANTFQYFNAEYRAWYVGFQAQHGRVPTNQEAMEQRIRWQLDPDSPYGPHAAEAMKDPNEAQKFYDFLGSVTGETVDASNWQAVVNSDPVTWPNLSLSPAPVPVGNNDNR